MDVMKYAVFVVIGMIAGAIMIFGGQSGAVGGNGDGVDLAAADTTGFIYDCDATFRRNDQKFPDDASLDAGCACMLDALKRQGVSEPSRLRVSTDVLDTLLWAAGNPIRHQQVAVRLQKTVTGHGYDMTGGQKMIDATLQSLGHCSKPGNI